MPEREAGSVRTIDRAIDLLTALERAGRPLGLSDLGRATNMPKCTVLRLVAALELRGFIEREHGRYQLGAGVVPFARAFLTGNSLTRASQPVLEELALTTGETASLWVRQGFERMIVQQIDSPSPLRFAPRIGQRVPVYLGASGHVLTAGMPAAELESLFIQLGEEIRLRSGDVETKEQLRAKLERVRQQGFAISVEETLSGVVSVAVPVVKPGRGAIAAISVSGPVGRMPEEKLSYLALEMRRAAEEIAEPYRSAGRGAGQPHAIPLEVPWPGSGRAGAHRPS